MGARRGGVSRTVRCAPTVHTVLPSKAVANNPISYQRVHFFLSSGISRTNFSNIHAIPRVSRYQELKNDKNAEKRSSSRRKETAQKKEMSEEGEGGGVGEAGERAGEPRPPGKPSVAG